MDVYIEYVLFNNFVVTFLILNISYYILRLEKCWIKIILASFLGAVAALLYPLITISGIMLFVLKMLVGFLICCVGYKEKKIKTLLLYFCTFLLLTALYGGFNLMLYFAIYGSFGNDKNLPTALICLSLFILSYILKQLFLVYYHRKLLNNFIYDIELKNKGKTLRTKAYLDSGNILCDNQSKKPIIVINYRTFLKLFKKYPVVNLLTGKTDNLQDGHYIQVGTAVKKGNMLVFCIEQVTISINGEKKVIESPMLGLSRTGFKGLNCDILLNPKLIV